jgi:hypothetical protein
LIGKARVHESAARLSGENEDIACARVLVLASLTMMITRQDASRKLTEWITSSSLAATLTSFAENPTHYAGTSRNPHFHHNDSQKSFYRVGANIHASSDLLAGQAQQQKLHGFPFALR